MKNIPSLKSIMAFESSARHKSFSIAADELNLTPGAVSKQIQKLEEKLGVLLFNRVSSNEVYSFDHKGFVIDFV